MRSICFDGHLGALHLPSEGTQVTGKAVVLCPALGTEAKSSYRHLFLWAESLAAHGHCVLRYDHRGDGDSLELDAQADQWSRWVLGVGQAAETLRAQTGASQLVLAGLRVGGLLAAAAAAVVRPQALLLLAPIVSGEAWLRELRWSVADTGGSRGRVGVNYPVQLSAAALQSLNRIDLRQIAPVWQRAFVAAPASTPDLSASLGALVTSAPFPGFARLFQEAHKSEAPTQVFTWARDWLASWSAVLSRKSQPSRACWELTTADWTERPMVLDRGLRAILCAPRQPRSARAVVFGNTAADPRSGSGNSTTQACRAAAKAGFTALRFDFLGVGESPEHPDGPPHVYETKRTEEFIEAAAALKPLGICECLLAGVCTGGFHAVRAVLESAEFQRALAINSWLVWRTRRSLDFPPPAPQIDRHNLRLLIRPAFWKDLAQGKIDLAAAAKAMRARIGRIRGARNPDSACLATRTEIGRAVARGADIRLVFGRGDAATHGLEADFGLNGSWLTAHGVNLRVIRQINHALLTPQAQWAAAEQVIAFLRAPASGAAERFCQKRSPLLPQTAELLTPRSNLAGEG